MTLSNGAPIQEPGDELSGPDRFAATVARAIDAAAMPAGLLIVVNGVCRMRESSAPFYFYVLVGDDDVSAACSCWK